jgi:hypothetical protein
MRKALMSLILAATVLTPVAASAQDGEGRAERIRQRNEQRQEARGERQQARGERQQVRQEARAERRVERSEVREQRSVQSVQPVEVSPGTRAFNRRGERNLQRARESGMMTGDQNRQEWRQDRRDDRRDWRNDRRDDRRDWRNDRRDDRRDWRSDRRDDRRDWRNSWNRNSWRNDRRYDWQSWRYRNRSLFSLSPYYSPYRNHRYSRFSVGLFLEPLFYSQRYWIGDPYQYRLPIAPPGTQWVRYYNDVLLVDTWSGEVVDVIYDFFW